MKSLMKAMFVLAMVTSVSLASCSEGERQALLEDEQFKNRCLFADPLLDADVPTPRPPLCTERGKSEAKWGIAIPVVLGVLYGIHVLLVRYTNVEN